PKAARSSDRSSASPLPCFPLKHNATWFWGFPLPVDAISCWSRMRYDFLTDTYETERIKVISAWSMFRDEDLPVRPSAVDKRGRTFQEHRVHQCVSEDLWFRNILDIDVGAPPLPKNETRLEFMRQYAEDSGKRLAALRGKDEPWWEWETKFFGVPRSR